jgi:hypothetical protein
VVFERPCAGRKRIDLWFAPPLDLSVEVKFSRPSTSVRPFTMIYGAFLADFNKVMPLAACPSGALRLAGL